MGGTEDDRGILNSMLSSVTRASQINCFLLPPVTARTLADKDWTKKDIASFLYEYARVPAERVQRYDAYLKGERAPFLLQKPLPLNPTDPVRMLPDPDCIRIIVAGGPHRGVSLYYGVVKKSLGQDWVTKKVELPANWEGVVKRYKNIVPTHITY